MRTYREAKIRRLSELVRSGQYRVDPFTVADAVMRRKSELSPSGPDALPANGSGCSQLRPRTRGIITVGHGGARVAAL